MSFLKTKTRLNAGFTLIELLIVVAIVGILAGVGIPTYNGYIKSSKENAVKNDIRSIALMQSDYFSDNGRYYLTTVGAAEINRILFSGKNTLDVNNDYNYTITQHDSGFITKVTQKTGKNVETFCLDNNNELAYGGNC